MDITLQLSRARKTDSAADYRRCGEYGRRSTQQLLHAFCAFIELWIHVGGCYALGKNREQL